MQLIINTKEDSTEEIRQAIKMLSALVDTKGHAAPLAEERFQEASVPPPATPDLFSMFQNPEPQPEVKEEPVPIKEQDEEEVPSITVY